ncbi:invasion protein IalB [Nitrobacteraceae bacterium AZCC 1564]
MHKALAVLGLAGLVGATIASVAWAEPPRPERGLQPIIVAQAAQPALPGGASSLSETYKDWQVSCAQQGTVRRCVMAQQQINSQNRQRVLAIEITAVANTKAEGTLVLPFGLMLDAGVKLQVDDGASGPTIRYRTCLTAGCLVPVTFDSAMLASLRKAAALKVLATADGGAAAPFSVSLQGFGPALDRIGALTR